MGDLLPTLLAPTCFVIGMPSLLSGLTSRNLRVGDWGSVTPKSLPEGLEASGLLLPPLQPCL